MSTPKVWIINKNFSRFKEAISTIDKNSENNFLYTNCLSQFSINDVDLQNKNFNIIFYSEEANTYIMFVKNKSLHLEQIKKYFDKNKFKYHEINFKKGKDELISQVPYSLYNLERKSKEIFVASNEQELKKLLEDSLNNHGNDKCVFYPIIDSSILFGYSNNEDKIHNIDKICFDGIISLKDKLIFISKRKNDIPNFAVEEIIRSLNIEYEKQLESKKLFKTKNKEITYYLK